MLTKLWRRGRELWRGDLMDREAQDEMAHHLELHAAERARLVSSLLFGVSTTDPAAAVAVAVLPLVAFAVSLHPAWRATRIDAADVLRAG